jgi:hypothetical protein
MYVGLILGVYGGWQGGGSSLRAVSESPEKIISEKSNYIEILSPMAQIKVYDLWVCLYIYIYNLQCNSDVIEFWVLVKTVLAAVVNFLPLEGFPRKNLCVLVLNFSSFVLRDCSLIIRFSTVWIVNCITSICNHTQGLPVYHVHHHLYHHLWHKWGGCRFISKKKKLWAKHTSLVFFFPCPWVERCFLGLQ